MRSICLSVVLVLAASAVGQKPLLDLTPNQGPPAAGSGAGALALVEQLGGEAAAIESKSSQPEAAVRAALRRLAQTLIATGEKAGQAGSARIVLGRTLVGALPTLDSAIAGAAQPQLLLAAGDIDAARNELAGNPDPDLVMRDALAWLAPLVTDAPASGGWIDDRATSRTSAAATDLKVDAWANVPGVTEAAVALARDLQNAAASKDAVYRLSAQRMLGVMAEALVDPPPAWLAEPVRRSLGEQFSEAAAKLSVRTSRGEGLQALSRLGRLAELVRRVEALDDSAAGKKIRAAAAQAIALPASRVDVGTIDSYVRLVKLAGARQEWPEERALIRQLRPGWRILVNQARQSEQHLFTVMPDALRRPEAMTDPGVLSAVTAHQRAVDDVEGLLAISRAFAAPPPPPAAGASGEPEVAPAWAHASERVMKVCQDFARPDKRDVAQASLRALITHVQTCWKLAGEDDLRAAVKEDAGMPERTSVWAKLAGGKSGSLLTEITDRRAGWINGWERGAVAGSDGERLLATRDLLAVMADAVAVVETPGAGRPGPMYAGLQRWPGWELSWTTMSSLATGLSDKIAEATTTLLAGDAGKAKDMVAKIRADYMIPLLAGRLAREGKSRGLLPESTLGAAVLELASGGPIAGRSWMGRWTDQLDDVCRYAEESVAARNLGAKDKADAILKYASGRAAEVGR